MLNIDHFNQRVNAEFGLLLAAFRLPDVDGVPLERPTDFDFKSFLKVINGHEVLMGLSGSLERLKTALTPEEYQRLKELIFVHSKRQFGMIRGLFSVLKSFSDQDIEVLPLKGPVLSYILFGGFGFRESVDLDLLIKPQNLPRATELLKELGCHPNKVNPEVFSKRQMKTYQKVYCSQSYLHTQHKLPEIELHWKMFESEGLFPKSSKEMLIDSQKLKINNVEINVMSSEDLMIYLSIHGAKHHWAGLKWLLDIKQCMLLYGSQIDWKVFIQKCHDQGTYRTVVQAVCLSHLLFNTSLPSEVLPYTKEKNVKYLIKNALENLLIEEWKTNNWRHTKNIIRLKPGVSHLAFYLGRLLIAPQDWHVVKLPDILFFLYLPLRPLLLLYRYSLQLSGRGTPTSV